MTRLQQLRQAAAILARQPDPAMLDMAAALDRVGQGIADSLDAELGLRRAPGQRRASTLARYRARNAELIAWKAARFAGLAAEPAAASMHELLVRYASSGWLRERDMAELPRHRQGQHQMHCWRILRADPRVPSAGRIRKLLATN